MKKPINVTESFLPELEKYQAMVANIWESGHLTNNGPLVLDLENQLKTTLGVKHLLLVSNGTLALQIAIKALGLKGEIITTPFSYVATVSSIVWENCTPVFVDIKLDDLCIDENLIEASITENTKAILATHVFGYPCNVKSIKSIAKRYGLKVIYDAAHAFNVKMDDESVLNHGDISTLSFHATKVFHTGEGGAVITNDDELAHRIAYLRNFGHNGEDAFWGLGINAKVSEFHAAMGLCVLPHISEIIAERKRVSEQYDQHFQDISSIFRYHSSEIEYNYSYYPVLFESESILSRVRAALNADDIFPRRYFYPALHQLPYVPKVKMQNAESVSSRILCLPLYTTLSNKNVDRICTTITNNL